ncbi:dual specificity protein phosphatase 4 [Scophthalmus maximus]|uniref:Dual specificity protein phosphatase n=1 Tax=Scophthalmus maximus TaxID=52904 RepID=A0A8D3B6T6_SCOMX|nr:dual specificity protein phosphatase 4 [Scophthalmus maximus]
MDELCEMDCTVLKRILKDDSGKCLLLDCRSFLAFSAGHIRGAVNARCNTIVRRRAKGSALSLDQILAGDEEVRGRLRSGMFSAAVLYDERTQDAEAVKEDSTVTLVLNALCRDASGTDIYLLKGGYDRFFTEYPEFCLKTKSLPSLSSQSSIDSGCSSCGTPHHDQGGPVEILPFLYLGSALHASKKEVLDAIGISALLNVSADCPNHFEGAYQYKCIPVEDNHKEDISCWFLEAIEFIDSIRDSSGRVLVHCQAGISRSATICLAYLMKRKRVRLDEAFEFVRRRRSIISPNFSFMGQLLQFESQVLATSCAAEAAATASPLLGPKSSATTTSTTATPTSPFIFNFPVSVVNTAYLHHSPLTTSPGC